jgi:hypothetical protein
VHFGISRQDGSGGEGKNRVNSELATLGLYWGARKQSLEECADLCVSTFALLRNVGFQTFFRLGRARREGLEHPIEESLDALRLLLANGVNRTDIDRQPIPQLGFRLGAWSGGRDEESYSLSITCGSYSEHVSNVVLLKLPSSGAYSLDAAPHRARDTFERVVNLWTPEIAALWTGDNLRWGGRRQFARDMNCVLRHPPAGAS